MTSALAIGRILATSAMTSGEGGGSGFIPRSFVPSGPNNSAENRRVSRLSSETSVWPAMAHPIGPSSRAEAPETAHNAGYVT